MTARTSRAAPTYIERVVTLEEARKVADERLLHIEKMIEPIHEWFVGAKAIRWLVGGLLAIAGVTAATVTATIGVIHLVTGH